MKIMYNFKIGKAVRIDQAVSTLTEKDMDTTLLVFRKYKIHI